MISQLFKKLLNTRFFFSCLFSLCLIIILTVLFVSIEFDIPLGTFTRDSISIMEGLPYYGLISNIGVILWSFTIAISLFSLLLLQSITTFEKNYNHFLFIGMLISLLMLLDDFFLAHEFIYPFLFGIKEKVTFGFYAILVLYYLTKFRKIIVAETNYIILGISLMFFAMSVVFDALMAANHKWRHFCEDIPKFIGITAWFGYHLQVAKDIVLKKLLIKQ